MDIASALEYSTSRIKPLYGEANPSSQEFCGLLQPLSIQERRQSLLGHSRMGTGITVPLESGITWGDRVVEYTLYTCHRAGCVSFTALIWPCLGHAG